MTTFSLQDEGQELPMNDFQTMMEKLLIFDCDGVLVDSELIANRIEAEALSAFGYAISQEECARKFTGLSAQSICQIILEERGIEITKDYRSFLQPNILQAFELELKPLLTPVIEMVHCMNVSRCIVSSSSKNRVMRSLEIIDQLQFFSPHSIFTSQQIEHPKPFPDLFLYAANLMGFHPENCIVIEDSLPGIEAALLAEMSVIAFLGGSHVDAAYQDKINRYDIPVAKNASELLQILKVFFTTSLTKQHRNQLVQKY